MTLHWKHFPAGESGFFRSPVLVTGDTEAVLVDAGFTLEDAPDAAWTEAEGFPYAGTYVGPDAIFANVFQRLASEWLDYRAEVDSYVSEGDQVVAFGVYSGTYRKTGRTMRAAFAHQCHLRDGKITRMQQYVDTHLVRQALTDETILPT